MQINIFILYYWTRNYHGHHIYLTLQVKPATRTLNFLKHNLSTRSTDVKAAAYLSMVRPSMEYTAAVWDPHHTGDIQHLEKVQRRAARWALNDYGRYNSVTSMLEHLGWDTLKKRRMITRLQTLFKILHNAYMHSKSHITISTKQDTPDSITPNTSLFQIHLL